MTYPTTTKKHPYRWLKRSIALLALLNLGLVFFDLTYIFCRDFYLQLAPGLTQLYDPVKGIEPHPETQHYLRQVNRLETQISQTGLQSAQAETLLNELQTLSLQLVEDNPFDVANKSSSLAKIKYEMRDRTSAPTARDAFTAFWSAPYLVQAGWQQEIDFFNAEVRPLLNANFYRDVNQYGQFVDYFWLIDLPFVLIFGLDFLTRTYQTSRRRPDLNWLEAILRRWYDLFLLLPFWRWLRVIPVSLRLYQTDLLNLEPLKAQLNHDFALGFAGELSETIGVQVIDQMQQSIQRGEVAKWLFQPESRRPYVQVNNQSEVKAIATRLVNISVHDVFPQIQPDFEDLVHHTLTNTLNQSPLYQQLQTFPGLKELPDQFTGRLAKDLSQLVYSNLTHAVADPVGAEIVSRLSKNFRTVLEEELQRTHNLQEIQSLLVDMLEEVKLNYVKGIAGWDIEKVVEEAEQLHRLSLRN
jgi:hypothetical protein